MLTECFGARLATLIVPDSAGVRVVANPTAPNTLGPWWIEAEPTLLGMSPHLLAVARRP